MNIHPMTSLIVATLLFPASAAVAQQAAPEGRLAQLYAPRPPAGSAFVRVLNPGPTTVVAGIANGADQRVGGATRATRYAIVEGGKPFTVRVAGAARTQAAVAAGSFSTLVLDAAAPAKPLTVLEDGGGSSDALKAEIRFYNLAGNCTQGTLAMADKGAVVFPAVAGGRSAARGINPVKARLVARCGGKDSGPLELPALQPGDHYSLFLTGGAAAPVLQGQLSGTDAVGR
ncbi:alginate O-acetyltransferase complex protein AlgF [Stenotrophomonas sp. AN71]|uniref:alginate O-acetyltransferase AlgF n=1 Tax=Stenotrophomonas sp. AN71 TaxID=3156253 RepID=UPI003D1C90E0